jgi:hypothetical protein
MSQKWSPAQHAKYSATMAAKRRAKRVPKVYSNTLTPVAIAANDPNDEGYKRAVRDLLPLLERLTR